MLFLLFSFLLTAAPPDSLLLVSWNVENFMDYRTDSTGRYTKNRFYAKCNAVSKTLFLIADGQGRMPDAVALMEVGNRFVLRQLIVSTPLRKMDYEIIHFDSPDHRGIDCALLWRRSRLKLIRASPKHLTDSTGAILPTRDILVAEFEGLDVLVNHHPSKVGKGSGGRRRIAMARMRHLMDSLASEGHGRIVSVGDFNDDVWSVPGSRGTIKYNGAWEKIDGCFVQGEVRVRETVFDSPLLSEPDRAYGGTKPHRSFSGPRWLGGASDHYPIILWISARKVLRMEKKH